MPLDLVCKAGTDPARGVGAPRPCFVDAVRPRKGPGLVMPHVTQHRLVPSHGCLRKLVDFLFASVRHRRRAIFRPKAARSQSLFLFVVLESSARLGLPCNLFSAARAGTYNSGLPHLIDKLRYVVYGKHRRTTIDASERASAPLLLLIAPQSRPPSTTSVTGALFSF